MTPQAMQKLMQHDWPGNVRELENTLEYAVTMTSQSVITDDLVLPTTRPAGPRQPSIVAQSQAMPVQGSLKSLKEARTDFEKAYLMRLHGNLQRKSLQGRRDCREISRRFL